jgi:hypothetical protein
VVIKFNEAIIDGRWLRDGEDEGGDELILNAPSMLIQAIIEYATLED